MSATVVPAPTRIRVTDQQQGFAGGLNTVSDPAMLAPNQARALTNVKLTAYGAAVKRGGTIAYATANPSTTNEIVTMAWWEKQTGVFAAAADGRLYKGIALQPTVWTLLTGGSARWLGLNYSNLAIFTDGTNEAIYGCGGIKSTDGTSCTDVTWTLPSGASGYDWIVVYNDRLWGGATTSPFITYSPLSTATGSIGGDGLGVAASGGGTIRITTAFVNPVYVGFVVGASLMLCQSRGISRLTGFGQSDITVQPQAVAPDVNILGPYAYCVNGTQAWVMTRRGLYRVTENGAVPVGTPDRPDPLIAVYATNPSVEPGSTAVKTRCTYNVATDEVYVWVPNIGVYSYHTILDAWSGPWNGTYAVSGSSTVKGGAFLAFPGYGTVPPFVIWSDMVGGSWLMDYTTTYKDGIAYTGSGGSAYTATIQCRRMFGADVPSDAAKAWRNANVLATLTSGGTAPTCTTASVYGGSNSATFATPTSVEQTYYNAAGGAGPYVDVTITDGGTTAAQYAGVTVKGFLVGIR